MIRNIKERKFLKITTVVDGVWMYIKTFAYVIILSPVILSCSFDEPWDDLSTTSLDDDEAYIAVDLTSGGTPLLLASEYIPDNHVNTVNFYFYDGDGNYVTQGEIDPNNDEDWVVDGSGNVTLTEGVNFVILKGLTGTGYPKYVVTVINKPTGFTATTKLKNMPEALCDAADIGSEGNFVMTSSTYYDENANYPDGVSYTFYTELSDDDFTANNIVSIPVERLAAKVNVTLGLDETVNSKVTLNSNYEETDKEDEVDYTLYNLQGTNEYVEFLGWKINAVARQSYLFKNIEYPWSSLSTNWTWNSGKWNDATNTRCYWAKSYPYGKGTHEAYPRSNPPEGEDVPYTQDTEADLCEYVKYVNLKTGVLGFDEDGYCPENTNTTTILVNANSTALTSVLIKAKAWQKNDDSSDPAYSPRDDYGEYMYYSVPIHHLNYDNNGDTFYEGEYGVVRNHHYTVTITGLTGEGEPVFNDEEDYVIVPSEDDIVGTSLIDYWSQQKETINSGDEFFDITVK